MKHTELVEVAQKIVEKATAGEQLEVTCSASKSTKINVYEGDVESFTTAETKALGVRVIIDGKQGFASAGSLEPDVLATTLSEARDNASFAQTDPELAIAKPDGVAVKELDLWSEKLASVTSAEKIQIAAQLEANAKAKDARVSGVRMSSYEDSASQFALASSNGIAYSSQATFAGAGIQVLVNEDDKTQLGFAYDAGREPSAIASDFIVDRSVSQAIKMLEASKPSSGKVTIVFDPYNAATFVGLIAQMLTGDQIIKGRSPFVNRVGETVAAQGFTLLDDPTDGKSFGASSYDGEGLACRPTPLISQGQLSGFLFDSYTGARYGSGSTGSAVRGARSLPSPGAQALRVSAGGAGDVASIIAGVDNGIFVYGLAGLHSGVNPVSGDISVGVEGVMIRNGKLAEAVSECTISSTLQKMLLNISQVGDDVIDLPDGTSVPSLAITDISLSGAS